MNRDDDRITAPRAILITPATLNMLPLPKMTPGSPIDIQLVNATVRVVRVQLKSGASELRVLIDADEANLFDPNNNP